ncbi:MAG: cell division protein FtsQ/DivIB [Rhizomicrobium sp.]
MRPLKLAPGRRKPLRGGIATKSARVSRAEGAKRARSRGGVRPPILPRFGAAVSRFFRHPILLLSLGLGLCVLLGALFASGAVGRGIRDFHGAVVRLAAEAGFGVSEIHLSGNARVPPQTILAALDIEPGDSIFAADLAGARARIMALDWIASVGVVRRYPGAIYVRVVEKRPFALWQSPKGIAVIERSGKVITTQDVQKFARLPKLVGFGAAAAASGVVDAVMGHPATAQRVAAYEYVSQRRWNLILNDGVVVKLPENRWRQQLGALDHLIADHGILCRDIAEIDLRSPTQYFFVLRSGGKKSVERGKET